MNIGPGLAESWEFTDDTTLVLKLREDVKFHNGDPLTSADVIYSLERALENPKVSSFIDCIDIENSSAVDEYTVELKTFYPFVPLLSNLALPSICIVSKNATEEAGGDIAPSPAAPGRSSSPNGSTATALSSSATRTTGAASPRSAR